MEIRSEKVCQLLSDFGGNWAFLWILRLRNRDLVFGVKTILLENSGHLFKHILDRGSLINIGLLVDDGRSSCNVFLSVLILHPLLERNGGGDLINLRLFVLNDKGLRTAGNVGDDVGGVVSRNSINALINLSADGDEVIELNGGVVVPVRLTRLLVAGHTVLDILVATLDVVGKGGKGVLDNLGGHCKE